jgi:hypothetical protein
LNADRPGRRIYPTTVQKERATLGQIALESKEFLTLLFAGLRDDLANQAGTIESGQSDHERIVRERAIYDALLSALNDEGELPDDEAVRECIVGLAQATDRENEYEQTALEHRAFAELIEILPGSEAAEATVDWNGLLVRLLHETQLQIIEAMGWVNRPMSASQLVQVFDESTTLASVAYHVRRLREIGILKLSWLRPVRGTKERLHRLARADETPTP